MEESDELYLLSVHGDASIKIRDGRMDVKHLERVNDAGLELWIPVMKAAFPLSTTDVASVLTALKVAVPVLERGAYMLGRLRSRADRPESRCVRGAGAQAACALRRRRLPC